MDEVDPALILRIDIFLLICAFALLIATFFLVAVNPVIGVVTIIVVAVSGTYVARGYRDARAGE